MVPINASSSAEDRLTELGITLPPARPPSANFVRAKRVGNLLYVAGHGPAREDGTRITGRVGTDLTLEEGYIAARLAGLGILATVRAAVGSLDRVRQVVKVFGMVNSAVGLDRQAEVMNGFSDLMVEVFGDEGRHARTVVGVGELPRGIAVDIEAILEIDHS
jgi:enamine deaminase RidA (YjgF/YER057c/UK114 family)